MPTTPTTSPPAERREFLLRMLPPGGVAAEIGVWKGEFSALILDICKPRRLHLIDPWTFQPQFPTRWYGGSAAASQADMDAIHDAVAERFRADPRVTIHRRDSVAAAALLPPASLDWVYIDGNHSYENVCADLAAYRPLLRPGGLLTGDDYHAEGVRRAVDELIASGAAQRILIDRSQFVLRVCTPCPSTPPPGLSG